MAVKIRHFRYNSLLFDSMSLCVRRLLVRDLSFMCNFRHVNWTVHGHHVHSYYNIESQIEFHLTWSDVNERVHLSFTYFVSLSFVRSSRQFYHRPNRTLYKNISNLKDEDRWREDTHFIEFERNLVAFWMSK